MHGFSKKQIILTVVAFFLFFLIGFKTAEHFYVSNDNYVLMPAVEKVANNNPQNVNLDLLWDVWDELDDNYLYEGSLQDDNTLVYGTIKGLVSALDDPYTVFMTPEETKEFDENLNAQLEGIGAELTVEEGLLTVVFPLKDSPAENAGLLPGDIIFMIEGEISSDMTLYEAIMSIRGEKGTDVTLTIIREDIDEPFEVTITRDQINIDSVSYEMLEGNIAYISVNQFSDNTGEEFDKAVQKVLLENPKGLVLDLRYNGGGYFDIAVEMVSEFIEGNKPAVLIQTKNGNGKETINVYDDAKLPDIPMVVLVNKGSASASEIVAGAIQDHQRGLLIGEQTFGKGSVQEVARIGDGASLRLTIAKWLTPSGRDIDEVGIAPDRIIEPDFEKWENEGIDNQLEEARKYLLNL